MCGRKLVKELKETILYSGQIRRSGLLFAMKGNQMNEIKSGMEIAYQGVKEEMETIVAELARKGIEKPKGFSALEQFIKDRLLECE